MPAFIDIRNALNTAFGGLVLSPLLPPIKLRNFPAFFDGDPSQIVCLSWGPAKSVPATFSNKSGKQANIKVNYALDVTVMDQGDYQEGAEPDNLIFWWDALWHAAWGTLMATDGVYDWDIQLGTLLDKPSAEWGYWRSKFRIAYTLIQTGDGK